MGFYNLLTLYKNDALSDITSVGASVNKKSMYV